MSNHLAAMNSLDRFGVLLARGPDARTFLQGQLSADVDQLTAHTALMTSCSSPQGRVQAVLWLIQRSDAIALLVPSELLDASLTRLRKYVLRAKVELKNGADELRVCAAATAPAELGSAERAHYEAASTSFVRWPGTPRTLALVPCSLAATAGPAVDDAWQLEDIRAGLPQVYMPTHERFVAQMLNVDLLGGISFEKGCYTGQEIIARTHFRGTTKRRMLRFAAPGNAPAPGTRLLCGDQHAGDVVAATALDDERCELLAVVSLNLLQQPLTLDGTQQPLTLLPLPYAIPELGTAPV